MDILYETPLLISKTKGGEEKFWQGQILRNGKKMYRRAITWRTTINGEPSKQLISEPYEVYPKNEGRANATTAEEQAYLEMQSIVKKQHDKGYHEKGKKADILPLPMLANKYVDKKKNIDWSSGVYMQPKYNGMRMLYDGKKAWSRGGKLMIPEVIQHLQFNTDGYIVDGELILPDMPVLQQTMKAAKKYRKGVSDKLIYVIYDIVEPDMSFERRGTIYRSIVEATKNKNIVAAPTIRVFSEQEMVRAHVHYTTMKFEGSILRLGGMGYEIGHRSNQLLKLKDFVDAEFEVVSLTEGDGKFKGKAIFICKTKSGVLFNVTPEGNSEHREWLWKTRKQHIKKWLTVRYQELTNDGVPQFPVGVTLRDENEFEKENHS